MQGCVPLGNWTGKIVTVAARSKSRRTIALTQVLEVKEEEPVLGWSVVGDSAEDI